MSGVLNAVVGSGGGVAAPTDAYFNLTTLLLHGNGTNGAQNNTFLDSSTNNTTITRNGNTTQGTFSPFSQTGWSNYIGDANYLAVSNNAVFQFGTGNFTVEGWFFLPAANTAFDPLFTIGTYTDGILLRYSTSSTDNLYIGGTQSVWSPGTNFPLGQWNHVALVKNGTGSNNVQLYVNGTSVLTITSSYNLAPTGSVYIGAQPQALNDNFNGYISNFRIVKGTAVYTSNFTVPTAPLTAITNTSLLTCQSNYFKDNSTNAFTVTPSGTPSVQAFSPFAPTAVYSTSSNGGSAYFDGTGDFLATPTSGQFTASGDFTVSCWFYLTSFSSQYYGVAGNWNAGSSDEWLIQIQNDGSIRFLTSAGSSFSSGGFVKLNQWTYFTATRSGTTVTVQLNGTTVSTYTKSDTLGSATKALNIGQQVGNVWPFVGYIADFRLLSGSAITAIPTAPSSSSGTGLLLSFTNAGIFDNTAKNNLETVSNAQISTTQSKFGSASMYFDGSGSYLTLSTSPINTLGDFTIEGWFYSATATTAFQELFGFLGDSGLTSYGLNLVFGNTTPAGSSCLLLQATTTGSSWSINTTSATGVTSNSTWMHIALVRSGGSFIVFVGGNAVITSTAISATTPLYAGTINRVGAAAINQYYSNGYFDDFRVTRGYARYTSNFTVPSAPFPDK